MNRRAAHLSRVRSLGTERHRRRGARHGLAGVSRALLSIGGHCARGSDVVGRGHPIRGNSQAAARTERSILRFGRTRTNIGVDGYNILNANPVLTYNQTYSLTSTTWLRPNSILAARFVKLSADIDF